MKIRDFLQMFFGIVIGLLIGLIASFLIFVIFNSRDILVEREFSIPWEPLAKICSDELGDEWEQIDLFNCVYEKSGGELPFLPSKEDYNDRQ